MSLRLPEPGSFEGRLRFVRVEIASRIRLSRSPATEPYWSAGIYCFDDPQPERSGEFSTCYAASSIEEVPAADLWHSSARSMRHAEWGITPTCKRRLQAPSCGR